MSEPSPPQQVQPAPMMAQPMMQAAPMMAQPMMQAPPVAYVVATAPAVPLGSTVRYRDIPMQVQCQHCNTITNTSTQHEMGLFTWLCVGAVCVLSGGLCGFGCCLIPLCIDDCKDVSHQCLKCHQIVGRYSRMG